jgi:hypothetical protein
MTSQENQQAVQLQQQKNWSGLLQLAQKAIGENRRDGWAWWYEGIADDGLGRKSDAIPAYETALPLMTGYTRSSIAQELAADYAALGQSAKLAALIKQLQSTDPQTAASLQAQYSGALKYGTTTAAPHGGLPDISPQSLSSLTAQLRSKWRADAIPVRVTVESNPAGGFQSVYDFYSASARGGYTVTVSQTTTTANAVANPPWGRAGIPFSFKSLSAVFAEIAGGSPANLQMATLIWQGATNDPTQLVWSLAAKNTGSDPMLLPAYLMSQAQLQQLQAAANGGNVGAQFTLGEVYASGIAGSTNPSLALQWMNKAAQGGNVPAANKLGQFEQLGYGTTPNPAAAARSYLRAAQAGFAPAQFNLGLLYEQGLGVQQDWIAADHWISAAARQGLQPAVQEQAYVRNSALRVRHAQELAAQQRQSSAGCNHMQLRGPYGCYMNPNITVRVIQQDNARTAN